MPEDRNWELRKFMEEKSLSVQDIAELCGVTVRTVTRWRQPENSATCVVVPALTLRWLKLTAPSK